MRTRLDHWTNPSVLAFSGDDDPVEAMTTRARVVALRAIDHGWAGPPFDPIRLAQLIGFEVTPNGAIRDARLLAGSSGKPVIEYNPTRPKGRVRYSIAHELAHTLFDDWANEIRHRGEAGHTGHSRSDNWQLEALCNIGAAEILMPIGAMTQSSASDLGIDAILELQRTFDVSTEAILIRLAKLHEGQCAVFCASRENESDGPVYRIDYVVDSVGWQAGVRRGHLIPLTSVVNDCSAVGYTSIGDESWQSDGEVMHVECVGVPAYPGSTFPRVVGMLTPNAVARNERRGIKYVRGDATVPRGEGAKIIVHVVNDEAVIWGGRGFATALRKKYPVLVNSFRSWAISSSAKFGLARTHFASVSDDIVVASLVAQHGFGPSNDVRLKYEALEITLQSVAAHARMTSATVHMPKIGTGLAGGDWELVRQIVDVTLVAAGIDVTVYERPN